MRLQKPREIAVQVLIRRQAGADYVEGLLDRELGRAPMSEPDCRLAQELTYGVVRWQATLDWLITRKAATPPERPAVQVLLRLGLYQLFWLDRIPDHAAVNETVALARHLGCQPQTGFINAVLRAYVREKAQTRALLAELKTRQPALGYSHPGWLVGRWTARWGVEDTARLLDWNNLPASTYARVNTLRTDPGKLLDRWREEGVSYDFRRWAWTEENLVFELKAHPPLAQLGSFQDGWFYVQDPSTLLAVAELAPQPGDTVCDVCAAPGGKSTYIAQRMGNRGCVVAEDRSEERLRLIVENCRRLGVTCVEAKLPEAPVAATTPTFDRVLVDAPCSNTGVLRRRLDLRWRLRPKELSRLKADQLVLLRSAVDRVGPGGVVVYSTCSLEPEENGLLVRQLLAERPTLELERERETLPFRDGVDGAYVARLVRRG